MIDSKVEVYKYKPIVDGYSVTFVDDMIAPYKSILDDYVASTGRKLRTL